MGVLVLVTMQSRVLSNLARARCRLARAPRQIRPLSASAKAAAKNPSWLELARSHPGGVVIAGGVTATVIGAVSFLLEFPEPCQLAATQCSDRPEIIELIGAPYTRAWWWEGSVDQEAGRAQVQLELTGPKGSGVLYANVLKWPVDEGGDKVWQVLMLEFHHVDESSGTLRTHSVILTGTQVATSQFPVSSFRRLLLMCVNTGRH